MATPRLSKLFLPTIKESPPGLSTSFALLLRGGIIRQSASGMYSFLPFGLRILNKIERIIDEEMEAVGGQKLSLPCILSADAWKRTGRWESTEVGNGFFSIKSYSQILTHYISILRCSS